MQESFYTINDIYALPDGERAELINGQIYYMAPPSRKHQDISGELFGIIRGYIYDDLYINFAEIAHILRN